jgi:hypothetical protein
LGKFKHEKNYFRFGGLSSQTQKAWKTNQKIEVRQLGELQQQVLRQKGNDVIFARGNLVVSHCEIRDVAHHFAVWIVSPSHGGFEAKELSCLRSIVVFLCKIKQIFSNR